MERLKNIFSSFQTVTNYSSNFICILGAIHEGRSQNIVTFIARVAPPIYNNWMVQIADPPTPFFICPRWPIRSRIFFELPLSMAPKFAYSSSDLNL